MQQNMDEKLQHEIDEELQHEIEEELQHNIEKETSPGSRTSLYSIKQKSTVAAWELVRGDLLHCAVECFSMPNEQLCMNCSSLADTRCIQCGPRAFYCSECCIDAHSKINLFHTPELWQVKVLTMLVLHLTSVIYRMVSSSHSL